MSVDPADTPLTQLLQRFSEGDREFAELIMREIFPKLHQIASRQVGKERTHAAITPTELINEVWISNLHRGRWTIQNRSHFYAIAAHAMRCVLVDLARKRLALSRGAGVRPVGIEDLHIEPVTSRGASPEEVIAIDRLMEELDANDPAVARILEMHYFCGFTRDEIATETGLTVRQVRYLEDKGRVWLHSKLKDRPR